MCERKKKLCCKRYNELMEKIWGGRGDIIMVEVGMLWVGK